MEYDSLPLSRNPGGAALSRPLFTSTYEQHGGPIASILTGADAIRGMIRAASYKISHSLAYVAFYQGDEILAVLPGTIIRADGVAATCASQLRFPTTKELRVKVTVKAQNGPQYWIRTHEGALLDADLSSNLAFIKFTPSLQPKLAEFGKPSGCEGVAVGCISRGPRLDDTDFKYLAAYISSMATTPGQDISANVQGDDSVIGGPLVEPRQGLVGVIHYANGRQIKATPIDEVLKCLERLEKREQNPKSIAKSFGDIDLEARPEIEPIHLDDEKAEQNGLHQSCKVRGKSPSVSIQKMEYDSLSWNPGGAALSRPLFTSTYEQHGGPVASILTGADAIRGMIRAASYKISHSLAYVAFYQGDEILAVLPGTIIRADGVAATCASQLRFPTTKELRVKVTVKAQNGPQYWIRTHEGALLDADLSSNLAFIKFTPSLQPKLAEFGKPSGCEGVAVGCISRGPRLDDTDFKYLAAYISSMATTPGQDISANVQGDDSVIGGPLVEPRQGLVGVIHYANGRQIKATPIDEVLKCLERLEKREQNPKSIAKSFGDIDLEARPEIEPIHLDDENAEQNGLHQSCKARGKSPRQKVLLH